MLDHTTISKSISNQVVNSTQHVLTSEPFNRVKQLPRFLRVRENRNSNISKIVGMCTVNFQREKVEVMVVENHVGKIKTSVFI